MRGDARAWALADQTVISLANFATTVLVARALGAGAFGAFVVATTVLLFLNSLQSALFTQPHNVLAADRHGEAYARYTGGALAAQTALSLLAAVAALAAAGAAAALSHAGVAALLAALAPAIVGWQAQEFVRRTFYTSGRPRGALANDVLAYGGQAAAVAALWHSGRLTGPTALVAIGATSALAAVAGLPWLGARLDRRAIGEAWAANWRFGKWLVGGATASWLSGHLYPVLAAAVAGPAATGIIRAAQTLLSPTQLVANAYEAELLPRAARERAQGGREAALRLVLRRSRLPLAFVALFCVAVGFAGERLLALLFTSEYAGYAGLLWLIGLGYVLTFVGRSLSIAVRTTSDTRAVFRAQAASIAVTFAVGVPLIAAFGVYGVLLGVVATALTVDALLAAHLGLRARAARLAQAARAARMLLLYENWPAAYRERLAGAGRRGTVLYRLRGGPVLAMAAGPHDVRVVNEVWLDRIYEPTPSFAVRDGWRVVDAGAHKGSFAVLAATAARGTEVHAIEPAPENLERLRATIALNGLTNVRLWEGALAPTAGTALLTFEAGESGRGSLVAGHSRGAPIPVRTHALEDVLGAIDGPVDLLKLDIEGAEHAVLAAASPASLRRVRRIVMEYHAVGGGDPPAAARSLTDLLERLGFRCALVSSRRLLYAERADVLVEAAA